MHAYKYAHTAIITVNEQKYLRYKKVVWPRKTAATKRSDMRECDQGYIISMHLKYKGEANREQYIIDYCN